MPAWWLEMDPKGESLPPELIPLAVARSLSRSPEEVRDWPEDDVLDQLAWMNVEGLSQERRMQETRRG